MWTGALLLELDEYRKFHHLERHIYGSTELTMLNIGIMAICKQLERKIYKTKLLKIESFAQQSFQVSVSISFTSQVR